MQLEDGGFVLGKRDDGVSIAVSESVRGGGGDCSLLA